MAENHAERQAALAAAGVDGGGVDAGALDESRPLELGSDLRMTAMNRGETVLGQRKCKGQWEGFEGDSWSTNPRICLEELIMNMFPGNPSWQSRISFRFPLEMRV